MSGLFNGKYGRLHESAEKLLSRAQRLRGEQPLDTLHILLAAIEPGTTETTISDILASYFEPLRKRLSKFIKDELQESPAPASTAEITDRLTRCTGAWIQAADERNVQLTDAFLLWAILLKDSRTNQLLTYAFNIDVTTLATGLEERFTLIQQGPVEHIALNGAASKKVHVPSMQVVSGSPPIDREMFSKDADDLLNALGESTKPWDRKFVILCGHNGSPVDTLIEVLALRLASNEPLIGSRAPLKKYKVLQRLDMEAIKGRGDAADLLERAKQVCLEAGKEAILLVDHIEALQGRGVIKERLKAQLLDQGEGIIFGRYVYVGERPDVSLGLSSADIVDTEPLKGAQTKAFLKKYCFPQWNADGYTFTPDAFDSILALEPGAEIDEKRMTLPYLAVKLGNDTIQTAIFGEQLILETAYGALEALEQLHKEEWPTTPHEIRDHYEETLTKAASVIKGLLEKPLPEVQGGLRVLTSAHVVAQLINHNNSEFHYPKPAPRMGKKDGQKRS